MNLFVPEFVVLNQHEYVTSAVRVKYSVCQQSILLELPLKLPAPLPIFPHTQVTFVAVPLFEFHEESLALPLSR